jgi:LPPG:FO 2-phospho-L-lactate transferase
MYTVLAGGVGASRFLQGLVQVVPPQDITVISNTGDDVEMFGLYIAPDVDIVTYALAGAVNPATGWGLEGDSLAVVGALRRFGYPDWFNLGDIDLATCLHRTRLLRDGVPYHEVTADIARAWGVGVRILPMADERVSTRIFSPEGEIPFQEYMVRLRGESDVRRIEFDGIAASRPAPGVLDAIATADVIVVAPSNPFVSVGPILAVPGIRDAIAAAPATKVGISPIIAGDVVKGPAARMLRSLGHEVSAVAVAAIYADLLDTFVIDEQDSALRPAIEALGLQCAVTDTMMTSEQRKAELAADTLAAAGIRP